MGKELGVSFVGVGAGGLGVGVQHHESLCKRVCSSPSPQARRVDRLRLVKTKMALETSRWAGKNQKMNIDGIDLSFDYIPGKGPVVMYLPQFFYGKDPFAKSNAVQAYCERRGQAFLVQDYYGTGRSGGDFKDGTLSMWVDHAIEVIERVLGREKIVLVTSGVGAWVAVHVAMRRSSQIVGIVGMSVDPDFTEELIIPALTEEQKAELETNGVVDIKWGRTHYPISTKFLDDARNMLVLRGGPDSINVNCPVCLLQGMSDEEIPVSLALRFATCLKTHDLQLTYVKGGDHLMERESDFRLMCQMTQTLLDRYYEYDLRSPSSG